MCVRVCVRACALAPQVACEFVYVCIHVRLMCLCAQASVRLRKRVGTAALEGPRVGIAWPVPVGGDRLGARRGRVAASEVPGTATVPGRPRPASA